MNRFLRKFSNSERYNYLKKKFTTKQGWFGNYDYKYLMKPTFPYKLPNFISKRNPNDREPPPFFHLESDLPIMIIMLTGFQHSLACLAGIITPPTIISTTLNFDSSLQSYMISASLIASGLLSIVQMLHLRIPFTSKRIGTGILTIVGTSFATLPVFSSMASNLYDNGTCPLNADGSRASCPEAYGLFLGTAMLCSLLEIGISFLPAHIFKKLFPKTASGVVILMIGANLVQTSGFPNWAGGSNGCTICPDANAPHPLPYGAIEFIGLGFLSFVTIIVIEIFGSPFMKNASLILSLIVGCIVAGACNYIENKIKDSPVITFNWVYTFSLKLYPQSILQMLTIYMVIAIEAAGDIAASSEASRLEVSGSKFDERVQGGLLADGLSGILSGCLTVSPMSIFAQNNGVIVISRCANRQAGFACAGFLILYGVLGKISGLFLSIPNPVLGGMTTFLFANVMASGAKILASVEWNRRERFIIATAFSFAWGTLLVPDWAESFFRGVNANEGLQGLFQAITNVVSTPSIIGGLVAIVMNLIMPEDADKRDLLVEEIELGNSTNHFERNISQHGNIDDDIDDLKQSPDSEVIVSTTNVH